MTPFTLALLPGLDGTGTLFKPLLDVIPPHITTKVITYPTDQVLSYPQLLPLIDQQLPAPQRLVLLGESFSGPLALNFAAAHPDRVNAVILCATFIRCPMPRWICRLARAPLFALSPPGIALRMLLTGWNAPRDLVNTVCHAIRSVKPAVLAARIRELSTLDCADALARFPCPIIYLQAKHDTLVRPNSLREIQAQRPDVIVRSIAAPHLLLQSEPKNAWLEINSFLHGFDR